MGILEQNLETFRKIRRKMKSIWTEKTKSLLRAPHKCHAMTAACQHRASPCLGDCNAMSRPCQRVSTCHGHGHAMSTPCQWASPRHDLGHAMTRPCQWASPCHGHGRAVSRPCQQASPTAETWEIRGLLWFIQKLTSNVVYKIFNVEKKISYIFTQMYGVF